MREIAYLNLTSRLVLFDDETTAPITNFFNDEGEDTDDPSEAVGFVAGPDSHGRWFTGTLGDEDIERAGLVH